MLSGSTTTHENGRYATVIFKATKSLLSRSGLPCPLLSADRAGADLLWVLRRCGTIGGSRGGAVHRLADLLRPVPVHERVEEQQAPKEERSHDDHCCQPAQGPHANGEERGHTSCDLLLMGCLPG